MAELDFNYIAKLVEFARAGDSDAFAELYAATVQKQYAFSRSYLRDDDLAQDALQETYVTALKYLNTLNDPKLFVSWLNQINFRTCYKLSARQARYDAETAAFESGAESAESEALTPEEHALDADRKDFILQQVMALPYSESQVIFLHYFREMKLDAVAEMLQMSRSTVKRCLASGKKRLREMIMNEGGMKP